MLNFNDINAMKPNMLHQPSHKVVQHSMYESDEHDGIESICSCTINMGYVNNQTENSDKISHQMGYDYQENLQRRNKASIPSMMIHGETR